MARVSQGVYRPPFIQPRRGSWPPSFPAAQAVTPVTVTVTATPGSLTVTPGPVDITPQATTVNATPGSLSLDLHITPAATMVTATPGTLSVFVTTSIPVATGSDDAREISGGAVNVTEVTLEYLDATTTGGYRFTNLPIAQAGVVDSAVIKLTVSDSDKNDAEGTWFGHDVDDSSTFTTATNDITSRALTTASVAWTTNDLGTSGTQVSTPNLATVLQEIVDRAGWVNGNDASFIYDHNSATDKLSVAAFDHASLTEPILEIRHESAGAAAQAITPAPVTVTATPGSLAVDLNVVPAATTATVTPGTLSVGLNVVPAPVTVTATPGSLTLDLHVTPAATTVTATSGTLVVTQAGGAQAITPAPVTVSVSAGSLTVIRDQAIVPAPVTVSVTAGSLSVSQHITPAAVTVTATPGSLTVIRQQFVTPAPTTVTVAPGSLTVFAGEIPIIDRVNVTIPAGRHTDDADPPRHGVLVAAGGHSVEVS